jgi:hypothetical protein
VRHFFKRVKELFTYDHSVAQAISLILLASVITACEPKHDQTDQTQAQVTAGNTSLQRMEEIDRTLRADGILIKHPALTSYVLDRKTEAELATLRATVAEYIQHAESVMKIASLPDIRFSDKDRIAESLAGANRLIVLIDRGLGRSSEPAKERLTQELWSEWRTCQKWTRENLSLYGIEMRPDLMNSVEHEGARAASESAAVRQRLARLGRQRRLRVNKMAQRHLECLTQEVRIENVFGRSSESRALQLTNLKLSLEQIVSLTTAPTEP